MILINEFDYFEFDSTSYALLNYISGACDILDKDTFSAVLNNNFNVVPNDILQNLIERKYIFYSLNDYKHYLSNINNKLVLECENELPNFVLIPSYHCNFACDYCFERKYPIIHPPLENISWINHAFSAIDTLLENFSIKNPSDIQITLMGGEPLMQENLKSIPAIIQKIKEREFSYNIITNGYQLDEFIPFFESYLPECIQITLDGPQKIHDKRRICKNGKTTFKKILSNIQMCLNLQIKVFVRVNVDDGNIDSLYQLKEELSSLKVPNQLLFPYIYPIQDGGCIGDKRIIDENYLINKLLSDIKHGATLHEFFEFRFHGYNLFNSIFNNEPFSMKLKNCSASGKQFILDSHGNIYKCWFGVGQEIFKVGDFIPRLHLKKQSIKNWQNRTILSLDKCKNCKYRYICGGGCISHILSKDNIKKIPEHCVDYKCLLESQLKLRMVSYEEE